MPELTFVIPTHDRPAAVSVAIASVLAQTVGDLELIVVDDGSSDGTRELYDGIVREHEGVEVAVELHERNRGKGAALRTGFARATGDIVLVQDADLEYDPREYPKLLAPILEGKADVVYGSRFLSGPHRVLFFWHSVGNKMLTLLSNMVTNLNLTDMETCYKAFRTSVLRRIELKEDRFGFEPEVTAKVAHLGVRVYEVGVSYSGRDYQEGKKIGWKDGVRAIYAIGRYNFFDRH